MAEGIRADTGVVFYWGRAELGLGFGVWSSAG